MERAPWHLWVVGATSFLWNAGGAFDYTMTQTRNAAYLAEFTAEQLDYFLNFPGWVVFFWAVAVWFSVLGSVLLLLRRRLATPLFGASFVAMVVVWVYQYVLDLQKALQTGGTGGAMFALAIFAVAAILWGYTARMGRKGVLR